SELVDLARELPRGSIVAEVRPRRDDRHGRPFLAGCGRLADATGLEPLTPRWQDNPRRTTAGVLPPTRPHTTVAKAASSIASGRMRASTLVSRESRPTR